MRGYFLRDRCVGIANNWYNHGSQIEAVITHVIQNWRMR